MFDFSYQANRILSLLLSAREILIVTHQKPDGDAIGSATACVGFLQKFNIHSTIYCHDSPPEQFHFLPYIHHFTSDSSAITRSRSDLIVVLDSSDLTHAGIHHLLPELPSPLPVINIDHHATNVRFGDHQYIDPIAPSTTTILFRLFASRHRRLIDHHIATSLLTGLLTDTSHFSNPATNEMALATGAELLKYGARFRTITAATWQRRELSTLRVWGKALTRLQFVPEYRVAISVLSRDEALGQDTDTDHTEGIANFLSSIKDADIVLLLKDQGDGTIRGSMRTIRDDIDVSRIARSFGGGGHTKAAGFKIRGTLIETDHGWRIL